MPELPDVELYIAALRPRIVGRRLERVRLFSPFVLRSFEPPLAAVNGETVGGLRRLGKRIVLELAGDLFVVIHLMVAGRFQWWEPQNPAAKPGGKIALAAFDFEHGTLGFTEASKKKRASLYVVRGEEALREHDPGGLDPLSIKLKDFRAALTRENHTVKRTLTDPRVFSGIGNAYSDEILHRAKVSPLKWTTRLDDDEIKRLHAATGKVLADRSLSQLLKDDWPRTLEEWEAMRKPRAE